MSVMLSGRGKSWVFQVTALCIVLGMLLALSLKTQREAVRNGPSRLPALRAEYANLKIQNANLLKDLADYQAKYEKVTTQIGSGQGKAHAIEEALTSAKMLAGTIPVHGSGVIVTLRDSPQLNKSETQEDAIEDYVVHDYDIREVVNELYAAGAEAAAVNDQRMVTTSSVRCAGATILVNTRRIAPPYIIRAVGAPDTLKSALEMQGGPAQMLFLLDMIQIEKKGDVTIPAYKGSMRFENARPVEPKK